MKCRLLVTALLIVGSRASAQQPPVARLPVIRPTLTVLGDVPDPGGRGVFPSEVALSPNGRLITFSTGSELRLWNTITRTERVLFPASIHTLMWSPGGDAIAFDGAVGTQWGLWAVGIDPVNGTALDAPVLIDSAGARHGMRYSPDQQLIAFGKPTSEPYMGTQLTVSPAGGGPGRALASAIDLRGIMWTPDGSSIHYDAYAGPTSATRQSFRVLVRGGAPVPIEAVPFNSDASLWEIREPSTGSAVAMLAIPDDVTVTDWSGRNQLAGVREVHPRGLRVVRLEDGMSRDLVDTTAEVGVPSWSADGKRIAIIIRRNGATSLLAVGPDGTDARMLPFTRSPFFDGVGARHAHLQVSPDGRFAAFIGNTLETLELMDLGSGEQRTLISVTGNASAPEGLGIREFVWNDDSRSIRYLSGVWTEEDRAVREVTLAGSDRMILALPRSSYPAPTAWLPSSGITSPMRNVDVVGLFGGADVTLVPLGGGPALVIARAARAGGLALSPDRLTLAVLTPASASQSSAQISLISLTDSTARNLPLPFVPIPGVSWHPDAQRLFVFGRARPMEVVNVYSVPANGDAPQLVASTGSTRGEGALSVSPDGRFIAFTIAGAPSATFVKLDFNVSDVIPSGGRN